MVEAIFSDMKKLFELVNLNLFRAVERQIDIDDLHDSSHPLITISREYGSGGSIIAKKVAARLGKDWKVYHKEIVEEIAQESRLEKKLIRAVDEKQVPAVEEIVGDLFGRRYMTLQSYHKHLVKILSVVGAKGRAVIIGRGAHFLFPHALKVRIIAPDNWRIQTVMKYEHVSRKRAISIIEKKDREREEFNRSLFRSNIHNPYQYDITIQTGDALSMQDAVRMILTLAKRRFTR